MNRQEYLADRTGFDGLRTLKQVFLFDGVHQPTDDQNLACDILVKLGFGDPREGDSE